MRTSLVAATVLVALASCASPPARHPTSMEALPQPPPDERQQIVVAERAAKTLVVGEGVALCTADDPTLLEVWGTRDAIAIVGKKRGRTVLHVKRAGKPVVDVDVEIAPPMPNVWALGVGQTITLPAEGIREYSSSGPGFFEIVPSSDGKQLLVSGRRPGTGTVLFIHSDGTQRSAELIVVGGDRQL